MTIHTVAGIIRVPDHGVIEVHPDHTELHAELRGRGFGKIRIVKALEIGVDTVQRVLA